MACRVYGRDAQSGEHTDPFFTEAATEAAARAEAAAQGMIVESVEPHVDTTGARAPREGRPEPQYEFTPDQDREIAGLAWYMRILGGALILFGGLQLVAGLSVPRQGNAFPLLLARMMYRLVTDAEEALRTGCVAAILPRRVSLVAVVARSPATRISLLA